jgi:hypothetical protein
MCVQSGLAGKFQIVTAEGGEHNILDDRLVVRDFAHSSGAGGGIVQPMRGGRTLRMREIAGTGRASHSQSSARAASKSLTSISSTRAVRSSPARLSAATALANAFT